MVDAASASLSVANVRREAEQELQGKLMPALREMAKTMGLQTGRRKEDLFAKIVHEKCFSDVDDRWK